MNWKGKLAGAVFFAIGVVLAVMLLRNPDLLDPVVAWLRANGAVGAVAFVVGYAVAVAFFFPLSILSGLGGMAFGWLAAAPLVIVANVAATALVVLAARTFARPWVVARFARDARFARLDSGAEHDGFRLALLVRLSALPHNAMNYVLGVTAIPLKSLLVATAIGQTPYTWFCAYVGSVAFDVRALVANPTGELGGRGVFFAVLGVVASAFCLWWIGRWAMRLIGPGAASESAEKFAGE